MRSSVLYLEEKGIVNMNPSHCEVGTPQGHSGHLAFRTLGMLVVMNDG